MRKLLKYELRSMVRKLVPLYAAVLLLSVLGAVTVGDMFFMIRSNSVYQVVSGVGTFVYVGLMIGMYVITLLLVLERFYKGVLGDEGYLTHMLPLPTRTIVWSKLWSGSIAFAATGVVTLLSFAILLSSELFQMFYDLAWSEGWAHMMEVAPDAPLFLVEFGVVGVISLITGVATLYLCMALGHLSNKHRILMSFVAYMGLSMVSNTLSNIALQVLEKTGALNWAGQLLTDATSRDMLNLMHTVMLGSGVLTLVMFVLSMLATTWIVQHKLNLE